MSSSQATTLSFIAENGDEVFEYRTCPICGMRCENRADDHDDWHVSASGYPLTTEGAGPDKVWYCSDSCRMQAMYQAATPEQQEGLRELMQTLASLPSIARKLGFQWDSESREWEWSHNRPQALLWQWDFDDHSFRGLLAMAGILQKSIYGSADNEQPAFAREAENEVRP